MELDKEEILNELMNFERKYGRDCERGLPECLERFLVNIAKSGDTIYPWNKIKPVIQKKMDLVLNEFNTKYPYENNPVLPNVKPFNFHEMKDDIIEKLDYLHGAPFTIQRICELLTDPSKYYKRCDKFMRGLDKNVRVISTIETRRVDIDAELKRFEGVFELPPKNNSSPLASSSSILLSSSSSLASSTSSPSSSSTSASSSSSTAFMNGLSEKEPTNSPVLSMSSRLSQSCSPLQDQGPLPNSPAPLQQLDSFTTVFASPPSTPLAVVSDIHPYDAGSPSSSSSSSSESSPQPSSSSSPPPSLAHDELNQSIDAEFDDSKPKDDDSNDSKSEDSNEQPVKLTSPPDNVLEQGEPMDQSEDDEVKVAETQEKLEVEDIIKLEATSSVLEQSTNENKLQEVSIKEEKEIIPAEQCPVKETNIKDESLSEKKEAENSDNISSLSESSSEKNQESQVTGDQSADGLIEVEDSQVDESIVNSKNSVVASITDTSNSSSSGQNEETDANLEGVSESCGGDAADKVNVPSSKTNSTESLGEPVEDKLTSSLDIDQDKEHEPDQVLEHSSSGSSTASAEETIDNGGTTSNQLSDIDEKSESH